MNKPALKGEVFTQGYKTMEKQNIKTSSRIKLGEARQLVSLPRL